MNREEHFSPKDSWDDVEIVIVGAGKMGASLAQAYAQNGISVGLISRSDGSLNQAFAFISKELKEAIEKGIFATSQVDEIRNRISGTTSYEKGLKGKCLKVAIETVKEDFAVKKQIFETLDRLCAPHVLLATNTSSLDANLLARETKRQDKFVWMHYFFPPHKNRAGEYAGTENTSSESKEIAARYMKLARKTPTPLLKYRKGGAANVIFISLLLEAARMVDEGLEMLTVETAGKEAFAIPVGFLSLMEVIGIPLAFSCIESFSDSSFPQDPLYEVYNNFFTLPESYRKIFEEYKSTRQKTSIRWVRAPDLQEKPQDATLADELKKRFLAVAFMTATELVDSGIIEMEEVDKLCQNAFQWKEGPFSLMNKVGIGGAMRLATERMELSHRKEINFPLPKLLIAQAQKNEPWPLKGKNS